MKKLVWILLALLLCGCGHAQPETATTAPIETTSAPTESTHAPTMAPTTEPETQPQPEHFTLTFAGDCTFGRNHGNVLY